MEVRFAGALFAVVLLLWNIIAAVWCAAWFYFDAPQTVVAVVAFGSKVLGPGVAARAEEFEFIIRTWFYVSGILAILVFILSLPRRVRVPSPPPPRPMPRRPAA